jgi:ParB family chromosome partitioning protein
VTKERRLGRGLEALLGLPFGGQAAQVPATTALPADEASGEPTAAARQYPPAVPPVPATDASQRDGAQFQVSVYEIDTNPYQPRSEFGEDELIELTESLQQHGLMQPVVLRRQGDRYQLIAGERRWRAATRAGWTHVPAVVREADDRQVAELTIVENLQRKDLGPLEKAASFQRYLETFQCTQEELAGRLSIDRSTVANLIRLLELPEAVREALRQQRITAGHARALLPLGDEREQQAFCQRIQQEQLSVRATEQLVNEAIQAADQGPLGVYAGDEEGAKPTRSRRNDNLSSISQQLRLALGTKVDVRQTAKGRGRITIHFTSQDEFDRLRAHLCGQAGQQLRAG